MNTELQSIVEFYHRDKGIPLETIFEAVESALEAAAGRSDVAPEELSVRIDRTTYNIQATKRAKVIEGTQDGINEIAFCNARLQAPHCHVDDVIDVEMSARDFGRIAAHSAKQIIMQRLREAEKHIVFKEYEDRVGEVLYGTVRRFERSDVIVELDSTEAVMPSRERTPTEEYQMGDRIRALLVDVKEKVGSTDLILSRSHPDFVRKLFENEVSEIADGTVEIKGIAREAGFRTKLAVLSHDEKVDPVGACVGLRGMRVKNIVRELSGEKIDIVRWSDDMRTYVTNSLAPAKLRRVELDEETRTVTVTVDSDQLSLAIGKRGQNARLTAKLSGWRVDIERDEEHMDFEERVALAISRLAGVEGIGEERAECLVQAGFLTIEGIMAADPADLLEVDGLDEEAVNEVLAAVAPVYEAEHGQAGEE